MRTEIYTFHSFMYSVDLLRFNRLHTYLRAPHPLLASIHFFPLSPSPAFHPLPPEHRYFSQARPTSTFSHPPSPAKSSPPQSRACLHSLPFHQLQYSPIPQLPTSHPLPYPLSPIPFPSPPNSFPLARPPARIPFPDSHPPKKKKYLRPTNNRSIESLLRFRDERSGVGGAKGGGEKRGAKDLFQSSSDLKGALTTLSRAKTDDAHGDGDANEDGPPLWFHVDARAGL